MKPRVATTIFEGEEYFLVVVLDIGSNPFMRMDGPMTEAEFRDYSCEIGLDDAKIDESIQEARKNLLK